MIDDCFVVDYFIVDWYCDVFVDYYFVIDLYGVDWDLDFGGCVGVCRRIGEVYLGCVLVVV